MLYNERHYSDKFCKQMVATCLQNISDRTTFNLVAMQGIGVTFFLHHLQSKSNDEFIFINSYEMQDFTRLEFLEQLAIKLGIKQNGTMAELHEIGQELFRRANSNHKIVFVFNRFDRFGTMLGEGLYDTLRYLREIQRNQIVMIFVTATPLIEFLPASNHNMLSLVTNTTYFDGYSSDDLVEICKQTGTPDIDGKSIALSGGNHSLLQLVWRCQDLENPLSDPMVELFIKGLYMGLNLARRKLLDSVVYSKNANPDSYLTGVGYLKTQNGNLVCFTTLLTGYVIKQTKLHLPVKERKLLRILQQHSGDLVHKQTIFDFVWADQDGIASDWALNALVYRLRRHPAFDKQRYSIESQKKLGYVLHDHKL